MREYNPEEEIAKNSSVGIEFDESGIEDLPSAPIQPEKSKFDQFSIGMGKGVLKTGKGLGMVGQWILDRTAGRAINAASGKGFKKLGEGDYGSDLYRSGTTESNVADELLKPKGAYENAGFMTERVAEFLLPATKITSAGKILGAGAEAATVARTGSQALGTAARLGTRGAVEGVATGGITAVQRNDIDTEAKVNALIATAFPFLGYATEKVGMKILDSVIKPTQQDIKNGFKISNVKKYDVGGPLSTSLTKTTEKLNKLGAELDSKLSGSKATIDVDKAFQETMKQVKDKKSLVFGKVRDMNSGLDELAQDIDDMKRAFSSEGLPSIDIKTGNYITGALDDLTRVPIQIANNQIKRGAGQKGAWVYGRLDKNAEAIDQVYSIFYQKLKEQIEKNGPRGIENLNKQMHDLIPIQAALLRRIPVADRANVLGLGENMALVGGIFDPHSLALMFPFWASKSGAFGNFMMKAAESWAGKGAGAGIKSAVSGANNEPVTDY